jgi:hypothetical protein
MFPPGMEGMTFSEENMPPQLKELLDAQKALEARAIEYTRADRAFIRKYAAIFCSCVPYYDRENPAVPPQAGCIVHGQVWIDPDTGEGM